MEYNLPDNLIGLQEEEVKASHKHHGFNRMDKVEKTTWIDILLELWKEPMLILLLVISIIYVLVGDYGEALFMFVAIIAVSAISFYQDNRSKKALEELEKLNEPLSVVIRNRKITRVPTHEIAIGDLCVTEEGKIINADGKIVYSSDFSVNESSLTGESYSVFKSNNSNENNMVYSGTIAVSGLAVFEVQKIGKETRIGKIGESIKDIQGEQSPLQIQIGKFVKTMAYAGVIIFLLVCMVSYFDNHDLVKSLLNGLTMAMSVLPEEIPVAFTTFMALGAWRLMKGGIIIKRSSIVETLGSTTVICTDKTGTITQNTMKLKHLYDFSTNITYDENEFTNEHLATLINYAMWSSEPVPFDPMEKTLHTVYKSTQELDQRAHFQPFHEYPLEGKPPMMTHIFEDYQKNRIIAAKGAPEAILAVSSLLEQQKDQIRTRIQLFGQQGYRVLGVARSAFTGTDFPTKQQDLPFDFLGLVVFYDPPKEGIKEVFQQIYDAGIKVKVITGDNADTTKSIAHQAGILHTEKAVDGQVIMNCPTDIIGELLKENTLFTRMFPEAKLAAVKALKNDGEIVAMLGDGVNDAPALKASHIGVAMGHKGTEIAKAAASLVITNDDLSKLVIGIAAGRRIYANIKKAIQYIISIHIPIIFTVSLPLFLGWVFPQIFTPVHVIFLELVMGPTCSIVYENEPMEKNTMRHPPRSMTDTFLNWKELAISIIQGIAITLGILFIYQFTVQSGGNEEKTRAMVFSTLIFANILLSLVNRSFYYSIFQTFKNNNPLFLIINGVTLILLFAILYITPFSKFFDVTELTTQDLLLAAWTAMVSVLWFEFYKWTKRSQDKLKKIKQKAPLP